MLENFLLNFAGVILGGIITWLVSRCYYIKSARDLKKEIDKLRWLVDLLSRYVECISTQQGVEVKFVRDETGYPKSIRYGFFGEPEEALKKLWEISPFDREIHEVK